MLGTILYVVIAWTALKANVDWHILFNGPWDSRIERDYLAIASRFDFATGWFAWACVACILISIALVLLADRFAIKVEASFRKLVVFSLASSYQDVIKILPVMFTPVIATIFLLQIGSESDVIALIQAEKAPLADARVWLLATTALLAFCVVWRTATWLFGFIKFQRNLHRDERGFFASEQWEPIPRQRHGVPYLIVFLFARLVVLFCCASIVSMLLTPLLYVVLSGFEHSGVTLTVVSAGHPVGLVSYAAAASLYPNYYFHWVIEGFPPLPSLVSEGPALKAVLAGFRWVAITSVWGQLSAAVLTSIAAVFKQPRDYASQKQMSEVDLQIALWPKRSHSDRPQRPLYEYFN